MGVTHENLTTSVQGSGEYHEKRWNVVISGSHVARDSLVSVMYSTKLKSTTSSVIPQRTDRHEILGQKPCDFQRLS